MLDPIDLQIIECLRQNARMQWKEIGQRIHLTGQAVADRVHRLEEEGIIQGYTTIVKLPEADTTITAFVTVFMKNPSSHAYFQHFVDNHCEAIPEAHRISGEGCYWLKVIVPSIAQLNQILNDILVFGNYKLNTSIAKVK